MKNTITEVKGEKKPLEGINRLWMQKNGSVNGT